MSEPKRSIAMAKLYEKRLPGGRVQLTGKMGLSRLLLVQSGTTNDGQQVFTLYACEEDAPAARPAPAERQIGQAANPRQRAELMFSRRP